MQRIQLNVPRNNCLIVATPVQMREKTVESTAAATVSDDNDDKPRNV